MFFPLRLNALSVRIIFYDNSVAKTYLKKYFQGITQSFCNLFGQTVYYILEFQRVQKNPVYLGHLRYIKGIGA